MNIALLLQMAADACPDRRALTSDGAHYSYADLFAAAAVAAQQIRASDCAYVSVLDVSSPAVPIALMGAAMAGIPYVPLNYRLSEPELAALLARIRPTYLIADDLNGQRFSGQPGHCVSRQLFLQQTLQQSSQSPSPQAPVAPSWPDDPSLVAVQLFTSGTTGTPKAAILRHEHLVSYILSTVEFMGATDEQATLVSVPPYHIAGISAVMSSIYACRRIVQLPDFSAAGWLSLAEQERVSHAFLVPTMLSRIIESLDVGAQRSPLGTVRAIAYGGGRMPVQTIERALALFPHADFTNAYGLTETSSTVALLGPEDHRTAAASTDPKVRTRLGSVGQPLPTLALEIRDDEGNVLGPDQPGEIYVKGDQVSGEYLERSALLADGWFPTRDAGYLDGSGYLYLTGRADDVIVRGGENIAPAEIEDVLLAHPAVADAAALGVPSVEWGEAVAAVVVLRPDAAVSEAELQAHVRSALRSSRVPERIRFDSELPYNETGKLLRRVLKASFA